MNRILLIVVFMFLHAATIAQFKSIAESNVFEEPTGGRARLLQMKNGTTVFFFFDKRGFDVKIYDISHKEIAVKRLVPANKELAGGGVESIFEANGDAVVMISQWVDKIPVLYRLVIDTRKGMIKGETKIAELSKYKRFWNGESPLPDFFIRKDPDSDNYALAMMNNSASEPNKKAEVVFYGTDHKELGRGFYTSPDEGYEYIEILDMAVIGDKKVSILAHAFNKIKKRERESELVLATLDAGSKELALSTLNFSEDMILAGGIARYNPVTKKIILLAAGKKNKKDKTYESVMGIVDPFSKKMEKVSAAYPDKASKKNAEVFGKKGEYKGMPANIFINPDGTFSIVYEEFKVDWYMSSSNRVYYSTTLGSVAVAVYDKNAAEVDSYIVPKLQSLPDTEYEPFYHSKNQGAAWVLSFGNQFKSFAYLPGKNKNYILFNDVERNGENIKKGDKLTGISGVGECDGFYFDVSGTETMPPRNFVFGKPQEKQHNLALFAISDYDRENNLYVTLKLVKSKKEAGVQIVWLQP